MYLSIVIIVSAFCNVNVSLISLWLIKNFLVENFGIFISEWWKWKTTHNHKLSKIREMRKIILLSMSTGFLLCTRKTNFVFFHINFHVYYVFGMWVSQKVKRSLCSRELISSSQMATKQFVSRDFFNSIDIILNNNMFSIKIISYKKEQANA